MILGLLEFFSIYDLGVESSFIHWLWQNQSLATTVLPVGLGALPTGQCDLSCHQGIETLVCKQAMYSIKQEERKAYLNEVCQTWLLERMPGIDKFERRRCEKRVELVWTQGIVTSCNLFLIASVLKWMKLKKQFWMTNRWATAALIYEVNLCLLLG